MFGMKREKCGLCGGKLRDGSGIMQYLAENDLGEQELFSMSICKGCADDMDKKHETSLTREEIRDWILKS